MELVAYLIEKNIPIKIINTFRTEEEQKMCLANGTSWVERSKHQDGLAIDICPWAIFELHGHNKLAWTPTIQFGTLLVQLANLLN